MPSADELRAALAAQERLEAEQDRENRKAQSAAWQAIIADPESWEWSVRPEKGYRGHGFERTQPGLAIMARVKPALVAQWRAKGFSTFSSDFQEGKWLGMFYYRTDEGILTHSGGGHVILNDPMLCSDEEWARMEAGDIPLKFQRTGAFK
jgi:hypothetical protein